MVVRALRLFVVAIALAWSWSTSVALAGSAQESLQAARTFLQENDLEKALKEYSQIEFGDPLWPTKVEDLIRHHLTKGSALEAWRLTQLLRRVNIDLEALSDYEALAVFRAGSCPLALSSADEQRNHLLRAATYRFSQTHMRRSSRATNRTSSEYVSHLAPGIVPFLEEIPRAELMKGQGCRAAKILNVGSTNARAEMSELLAYLDSVPANGSSDTKVRLLVLIRALQLAKELNQPSIEKKLTSSLETERNIPWLDLPDAERRFLFSRTVAGTTIGEVNAESRSNAMTIALRILKDSPSPETADWLAMVELNRLPLRERQALLERLSSVGSFKDRSWVLFELAKSNVEAGEPMKGLGLLRRLLVEKEEPVSQELEQAAVELATRVFSEHRADERLRGALQASLPFKLWNQLLDGTLVQLALKGRRNDFEQLAKSRNQFQVDFLRDVASRQLRVFNRRLSSLGRGSSVERDLFILSGQIAGHLISLDDDLVRELKPYLQALADALRSRLRPNDARSGEFEDLIRALGSESKEQREGGDSVRQGSLQMGVARWKRPSRLPNPFVLKSPTVLPLRSLIEVPDSAVERGWKISISAP